MAVKATNDFEHEMAQRFGGGGGVEPAADDVSRLRRALPLALPS